MISWHLLLAGLVWFQAATTLSVPGGVPPTPTPAPAAPDTVLARLDWAGAQASRLVAVTPDSVGLGEAIFVEIAGATTVPDSLGLPPWLEPAPDLQAAVPSVSGVVAAFRVYRLAPFRLQVGDGISSVIVVGGRNHDPGLVAPIRDPRLPGWAWRNLLAMAAALVLVYWLVRRFMDRRSGRQSLGRDRVLATAAWPTAALTLAELMAHLEHNGGERVFLNGLHRVARTFVGDRFLVPGPEMVGREIAAACVALGHDRTVARRFQTIIEGLDTRRYDPTPVPEAWCRNQARALMSAMDEVRIEPRDGSEADAAAAWDRLRIELAAGTGEVGA